MQEMHLELTVQPLRWRLGRDPEKPNRSILGTCRWAAAVSRISNMTSTRVPPRRIQTQIVAPTPSKPTISVEEWEAKAPLLDSATKSINAIKAASENRPLPPKVSSISYRVWARDLPTQLQSSSQMMPCRLGRLLPLFENSGVHHHVQGPQTPQHPQQPEETPPFTRYTQNNPSKPLNNSTIGLH